MNDDLLGQVGAKDFVPAHHFLAMAFQNLEQPLIEIGLECMIVLDSLLLHELLNLWILFPLFPFILVSADMHVVVGKQESHLGEESLEEFVDLFTRGIEGWKKYAHSPLDLIRPRSAAEFRMAHQPARYMARHIEFGNYANSALAGVCDHFSDLVLSVIEAVRPQFGEIRIPAAFDPK